MAKIKFFNAFVLKKNINATTSGLAEYTPVFPGLPNNPIGNTFDYPAFPPLGGSATGRVTTTNNRNWIIEESRIRGGYNNTETGYGVRAYLREDSSEQTRRSNGPKKTRQGRGKITKYGNKMSKKYYKKKKRGQG